MAIQASDAQPSLVSPTLVLLVVLARKVAIENQSHPQQSYVSWQRMLQETLLQVAERHQIPIPVFLDNISPFWFLTIVQCEGDIDANEVVYRCYGKSYNLRNPGLLNGCWLGLFLQRSSTPDAEISPEQIQLLFICFLVYARNQRGWILAILNTLDPAGALKSCAQLEESVETILACIYVVRVNVSGVMCTLNDIQSSRRKDKILPGFPFPSQVASLMLVETEDLTPVIAPIIWPIFGSVLALRYPTQPLRVAASTHIINSNTKDCQRTEQENSAQQRRDA